MTTARAILLEVKRRLGDTNIAYPDEADALAFLNRALLGIYNYAIYKSSPRIRKVAEVTTNATGSATVADGLAKVFGVADKEKSRILSPLDGIADVLSAVQAGDVSPYYTATDNAISVYPAATQAKTLILDYVPVFVKLAKRSDEVLFCPELENVIIEWTIGLIAGKQQTVNDIEFANLNGYANTLSSYFRGKTTKGLVGCGPW